MATSARLASATAVGACIRALCGVLTLAVVATQPGTASGAEAVWIGGTGMALAAMRQMADRIRASDPDLMVEVQPSLGTPGGLKALAEGALDIALAARPLKPEELAQGLREASCATTALIFASSHPKPSGVTREGLPSIYLDPAATWADGSQIKIILRSRAGSENPYLIAANPAMAGALAAAYSRPGVPVAATDQENADLATRIPGSFAVMTLLQLRAEKLPLQPLAVDGVAASTETVRDGSYPFPLRACLVVRRHPAPGATRFVAFSNSSEGQAIWRQFGAEPAPPDR